MWDSWWTQWHWDRFFPEYFAFPPSISFHRCSITWKNEEKLIIFITGLHKKPQGCGASVASAAGPFTTKKKWSEFIWLRIWISCGNMVIKFRVLSKVEAVLAR
jgi:hypothetical protein